MSMEGPAEEAKGADFSAMELAAAEAQRAMTAALESLAAKRVLLALVVQAERVVGKQDAMDVVQEFFATKVEHVVLRWRREKGDLLPFVISCLRNFASDWLRKQRAERGEGIVSLSPGENDGLTIDPPSSQASGLDLEIVKERSRLLWDAANDLPVELWIPFCLRYKHELKVKEIALALRMDETTVRGRLERARERLKNKHPQLKECCS